MKVSQWKIYPQPPTKAFKSYSITTEYENLINQIFDIIESLDANDYFTKISKEKNRIGKILFDPKQLNKAFKEKMFGLGWKSHRVAFNYADSTGCYEVDFYKDRVAVELQLGKYAFLSDNVIKLDIYQRVLDLTDLNVLIVPDRKLQQKMSSGVGYYDQIIKRLDDMNYQHPLVVMSIGLNPKN